MSHLVVSVRQTGSWEEPDFLVRRIEIVSFQEKGWQNQCELIDSGTDVVCLGVNFPALPELIVIP